MRASLVPLVVSLASLACGAHVAPRTASRAPSSDCSIDGTPLAAIPPASLVCEVGAPTADLAGALRLYQQGLYEQAAVVLERDYAAGPSPAAPSWWQRTRLFLAKTERHRGHDARADELFRDIVRSPDDPYRWTAAGILCGLARPLPGAVNVESIDACGSGTPFDAASRAVSALQPVVASCGRGRTGDVQVALVVAPDGRVTDLHIVSAGWYDDHSGIAAATASCVLDAVRSVHLSAFPFTWPDVTLAFALE